MVAPLVFLALRPLADRLFAVQINSHWPYLCAFARGEPTCFDAPIEACAQHLLAAVRANAADEIVVVGHSGGGAIAPAVMTRALELDPDLGRRGPAVVLLTFGSIAPGAALHPKAVKLRSVFARLAAEPSLTWIDSQSRKDVLNFWDFDPIAGIGIGVAGKRHNPTIWRCVSAICCRSSSTAASAGISSGCTISSSWRTISARPTTISCWWPGRSRSPLGPPTRARCRRRLRTMSVSMRGEWRA